MITVHVNAPDGTRVPGRLIDRALRATLRREGISRAELSVTFVSDLEITELHGRYLGHHDVTDVLAFALHQEGGDPLGDIYVGHAQALRQASEAGAEADRELVRLAIHGVLHVLGYDHPEGPGRVRCEMYRVQEAVLRGLTAERNEPSSARKGA